MKFLILTIAIWASICDIGPDVFIDLFMIIVVRWVIICLVTPSNSSLFLFIYSTPLNLIRFISLPMIMLRFKKMRSHTLLVFCWRNNKFIVIRSIQSLSNFKLILVVIISIFQKRDILLGFETRPKKISFWWFASCFILSLFGLIWDVHVSIYYTQLIMYF